MNNNNTLSNSVGQILMCASGKCRDLVEIALQVRYNLMCCKLMNVNCIAQLLRLIWDFSPFGADTAEPFRARVVVEKVSVPSTALGQDTAPLVQAPSRCFVVLQPLAEHRSHY